MNLLVCVADVLHPHDLQPPTDGAARPTGLRTTNRADECAVELAVRLRERDGGRVTLLSVAPAEAEETLELYTGLGAETLIRIWDPVIEGVDAAGVALALAYAAARLQPDLILCGDRAFGG